MSLWKKESIKWKLCSFFVFEIWDLHANSTGVMALLFCLACAYFYEQAPLRKEILTPQQQRELEQESLVAKEGGGSETTSV